MVFFGRRRWDRQPTAPAGVLLASSGAPFSSAAIRRARELAAGEPVAVLSILKVYGSSFGLPNPGLMPNRRERDEQYAIVRRAITAAGAARRHGGRPGHRDPQRRPDHREGGQAAKRPLRGDG